MIEKIRKIFLEPSLHFLKIYPATIKIIHSQAGCSTNSREVFVSTVSNDVVVRVSSDVQASSSTSASSIPLDQVKGPSQSSPRAQDQFDSQQSALKAAESGVENFSILQLMKEDPLNRLETGLSALDADGKISDGVRVQEEIAQIHKALRAFLSSESMNRITPKTPPYRRAILDFLKNNTRLILLSSSQIRQVLHDSTLRELLSSSEILESQEKQILDAAQKLNRNQRFAHALRVLASSVPQNKKDLAWGAWLYEKAIKLDPRNSELHGEITSIYKTLSEMAQQEGDKNKVQKLLESAKSHLEQSGWVERGDFKAAENYRILLTRMMDLNPADLKTTRAVFEEGLSRFEKISAINTGEARRLCVFLSVVAERFLKNDRKDLSRHWSDQQKLARFYKSSIEFWEGHAPGYSEPIYNVLLGGLKEKLDTLHQSMKALQNEAFNLSRELSINHSPSMVAGQKGDEAVEAKVVSAVDRLKYVQVALQISVERGDTNAQARFLSEQFKQLKDLPAQAISVKERFEMGCEIIRQTARLRSNADLDQHELTRHARDVAAYLTTIATSLNLPEVESVLPKLLQQIIDGNDVQISRFLNSEKMADYARLSAEVDQGWAALEKNQDPEKRKAQLDSHLKLAIQLRDPERITRVIEEMEKGLGESQRLGLYAHLLGQLKDADLAMAQRINDQSVSLARGFLKGASEDALKSSEAFSKHADPLLQVLAFCKASGDLPGVKLAASKLSALVKSSEKNPEAVLATSLNSEEAKARIQKAAIRCQIDFALSDGSDKPEGEEVDAKEMGARLLDGLQSWKAKIDDAASLSPEEKLIELARLAEFSRQYAPLAEGKSAMIDPAVWQDQVKALSSMAIAWVEKLKNSETSLQVGPEGVTKFAQGLLHAMVIGQTLYPQNANPTAKDEYVEQRQFFFSRIALTRNALENLLRNTVYESIQSGDGMLAMQAQQRDEIVNHFLKQFDQAIQTQDLSAIAGFGTDSVRTYCKDYDQANQHLLKAALGGQNPLQYYLLAAQGFAKLGIKEKVSQALSPLQNLLEQKRIPPAFRANVLGVLAQVYGMAGMQEQRNQALQSLVALDCSNLSSEIKEEIVFARGLLAMDAKDLEGAKKYFSSIPQHKTAAEVLKGLEMAKPLDEKNGANDSAARSLHALRAIESIMTGALQEGKLDASVNAESIHSFTAELRRLFASGEEVSLSQALSRLKKHPHYQAIWNTFFATHDESRTNGFASLISSKIDGSSKNMVSVRQAIRGVLDGSTRFSTTQDYSWALYGTVKTFSSAGNFTAASQMAQFLKGDQYVGEVAAGFLVELPQKIFEHEMFQMIRNSSVLFAEDVDTATMELATQVLTFGVGEIVGGVTKGVLAARRAALVERTIRATLKANQVLEAARVAEIAAEAGMSVEKAMKAGLTVEQATSIAMRAKWMARGSEGLTMASKAASIAMAELGVDAMKHQSFKDVSVDNFVTKFCNMMVTFGLGHHFAHLAQKHKLNEVFSYFAQVGSFFTAKYVQPLVHHVLRDTFGIQVAPGENAWHQDWQKVLLKSFVEDGCMKLGTHLSNAVAHGVIQRGAALDQEVNFQHQMLPSVVKLGFQPHETGEFGSGAQNAIRALMHRAGESNDLSPVKERVEEIAQDLHQLINNLRSNRTVEKDLQNELTRQHEEDLRAALIAYAEAKAEQGDAGWVESAGKMISHLETLTQGMKGSPENIYLLQASVLSGVLMMGVEPSQLARAEASHVSAFQEGLEKASRAVFGEEHRESSEAFEFQASLVRSTLSGKADAQEMAGRIQMLGNTMEPAVNALQASLQIRLTSFEAGRALVGSLAQHALQVPETLKIPEVMRALCLQMLGNAELKDRLEKAALHVHAFTSVEAEQIALKRQMNEQSFDQGQRQESANPFGELLNEKATGGLTQEAALLKEALVRASQGETSSLEGWVDRVKEGLKSDELKTQLDENAAWLKSIFSGLPESQSLPIQKGLLEGALLKGFTSSDLKQLKPASAQALLETLTALFGELPQDVSLVTHLLQSAWVTSETPAEALVRLDGLRPQVSPLISRLQTGMTLPTETLPGLGVSLANLVTGRQLLKNLLTQALQSPVSENPLTQVIAKQIFGLTQSTLENRRVRKTILEEALEVERSGENVFLSEGHRIAAKEWLAGRQERKQKDPKNNGTFMNAVDGLAQKLFGKSAAEVLGMEPALAGANGKLRDLSMSSVAEDVAAPTSHAMVGGEGSAGGASQMLTWLGLGEGPRRLSIRVPENLLPQAENLIDHGKSYETDIERLGAYLGSVVGARVGKNLSHEQRLSLMAVVYEQFQQKLEEADIHVATRQVKNSADRLRVIGDYNRAQAELIREGHLKDIPAPKKSAFVEKMESGEVKPGAIFGGQANLYFGELKSKYETYPTTHDLIRKAAEAISKDVASEEARETGFYTQGFDLMHWLEHQPPQGGEYLASSHISQPLILLTQLAHYYENLKSLGVSPSKLLEHMEAGTTGHSQGVMAAWVVASSSTEAEFVENSVKAVRYLFWQGLRMTEAWPPRAIDSKVISESIQKGDKTPTAMAGILKLSPELVQKYVQKVNAQLANDRKVEVSLVNGPRAVTVSGHPESLHLLREALRKDEVAANESQSRIPYSKRKLELVWNYFPVGAPFHTKTYMASVPEKLAADMHRLGIEFDPAQMKVPVYSTFDGSNLQDHKSKTDSSRSLLRALIDMQSVQPVYWQKATEKLDGKHGVTHLLGFGPGDPTVSIEAITARNMEGTGVQAVMAGTLLSTESIQDKTAFYDTNTKAVKRAVDWKGQYGPKLVRTLAGDIVLDTKLTRLTGKPPILQAGMTPTSANEGFAAAVVRAGYRGELAGGGQHTEAYLRERVKGIKAEIEPGDGIDFNLLFLNSHLFGFQYPVIEVMVRNEGEPIDGATFAAGVPSVEKATEYIQKLSAAGFSHVSFKPGSVESIKEVIRIAKASPEANIIIQWTGGRAGGHHSFEDMYDPILKTYAEIRKQPNLILDGGSGIGDGAGAYELMSGKWSEKLGYPAMPFDGVLLGSRLMVAREAKTDPRAKALLMEAEGVKDQRQWEGTYQEPTGGILTVISELGEPIHNVATRGIKLWKEFDDNYFVQRPGESGEAFQKRRREAIARDKGEIIRRINSDWCKLYFGKKANGKVVDLEEMTYAEVAHRMLELMYVAPEEGKAGRWIDVTFRDRLFDFMARIEARYHERESVEGAVALMQQGGQLEKNPAEVIKKFFEKYPRAALEREGTLSPEDIDFFISLCKRPGKPVNFIPVIDEELSTWFKKDTLWQSEDVDAVPGKDVQRIVILQGPVAVRFAGAEEPIGKIMGDINRHLIEQVKADVYGNDASAIPEVEYLGGPEIKGFRPEDLKGAKVSSSNQGKTFEVSIAADAKELPGNAAWWQLLSGGDLSAAEPAKPSWIKALLTNPRVVRPEGKLKVKNILPTLLRPRAGSTVKVLKNEKGEIAAVEVHHPISSRLGSAGKATPALRAEYQDGKILITFNHPRPETSRGPAKVVKLQLAYEYHPAKGWAPIHEAMPDLNARVKKFYSELWFDRPMAEVPTLDTEFKSSVRLDRAGITRFIKATVDPKNTNEVYLDRGQAKLEAPMDMAIVAAWEPLVQTLFPAEINANIFNLLHKSNHFKVLDPTPLQEGDKIDTSMRIQAVQNVDGGKLVRVKGTLSRQGKACMEIESEFFIRGEFADFENTFVKSQQGFLLPIRDEAGSAVLQSKKWFQLYEGVVIHPNDLLRVELETIDRPKDKKKIASAKATGTVYRNNEPIGKIDYLEQDVSGNSVAGYFARVAKPERAPDIELPKDKTFNLLPEPDLIQVPLGEDANLNYSRASFDLNPIHDNPFIVDLAGLPTPPRHGMNTSANGRRVVEQHVCRNRTGFVEEYKVDFEGMVQGGDQLFTQVRHVAMRGGKKVLEVVSVNQDGETVLKAAAVVAQEAEFNAFTGQGDASPIIKVVPELYAKSEVARKIWDRADHHLNEKFGFSLFEIAQGNPKELTIHFGGEKGRRIRENYRALKTPAIQKDAQGNVVYHPGTKEPVYQKDAAGKVLYVPVFPDIHENTDSYTFKDPNGLNFATQFTQPIVLIHEKAFFEDRRANGRANPEALFAGHSLGEYGALAAVLGENYERWHDLKVTSAGSLSVEDIAEITFMRGITMQQSVPRDAQGRSPYALAAIKPHKVTKGFTQDHLTQLAQAFEANGARLLEVVNYNVRGRQYVLAGDRVSLVAFNIALSKIAKNPTEASPDKISALIEASLKEAKGEALKSEGGYLDVTKVNNDHFVGLPVDVPFHSKQLLPGVGAFREVLDQRYPKEMHDIHKLVGRYIPNLVAKPFSLKKDFVQEVYDLTKSPVLGQVLRDWDGISKSPEKLGRALLIELLAYQFASPVKWVETQEHVLHAGVGRFLEFGHQATLDTMAKQTISMQKKQGTLGQDQTLFYGAQAEAADYLIAKDYPNARDFALAAKKAAEEKANTLAQRDAKAAPPAAQKSAPPKVEEPPVPAAVEPSPPAGGHSSDAVLQSDKVADVSLSALETIKMLVALKFGLKLSEVSDEDTIKEKSGGKSAKANELAGELNSELGNSDGGAEIPLNALAKQYPGYTRPGNFLNSQIGALLGGNMPKGVGILQLREHLEKERLLGPGRMDGVLLHALSLPPAARLADKAAALSWLDQVVDTYATSKGITIPRASQMQNKSQSGGGSDPKLRGDFEAYRAKQNTLIEEMIKAYAEVLDKDPHKAEKMAQMEKDLREKAEQEIQGWEKEHGKKYFEKIQPIFTSKKFREYNSSWNWARQDAISLYYELATGKIQLENPSLSNRTYHLVNRSDAKVLEVVEFYAKKARSEKHLKIARFYVNLANEVRGHLEAAPVARMMEPSTKPQVETLPDGSVRFSEDPRPGVTTAKDYVNEMQKGGEFPVEEVPEALRKPKNLQSLIRKTKATLDGLQKVQDVAPAVVSGIRQTLADLTAWLTGKRRSPFLFIRTESPLDTAQRIADDQRTDKFYQVMQLMAKDGVSMEGKTALITGAGPGSAGIEVVKNMLKAGGRVVVTTSNYSQDRTDFFRKIYEDYGAKGAELVVVPFNQASVQDVKSLVEYVYDPKNGLGLDVDYVLPFAGIPEQGMDIGGIGEVSEVNHRIMLTNTVRLLGEIKNAKAARKITTKPAHVVLPLSPNHGVFGFDGLYAESKLGLEAMMNKWRSEGWSDYLSVAGAVIGWTRGTNLMKDNDVVSVEFEERGFRTFNQREMGWNLFALMHPELVQEAQKKPVWADFNGGLQYLSNLSELAGKRRKEVEAHRKVNKAVKDDLEADLKVSGKTPKESKKIHPKANFNQDLPFLPSKERLESLKHLQGMVDLNKVVVVTGFGEVGPWGNARTRWEMEAHGTFSMEGVIELAWMTGRIKYHNGPLGELKSYTGWVDTKTNEPVPDHEVKDRYEADIIEHSGIRIIEPEMVNGYDPNHKLALREVVLTMDFPPVQMSTHEEAQAVKEEMGEHCHVYQDNAGLWYVVPKAGAKMMLPRALKSDRFVAGQLPTGWDPRRYGVPEDIIKQVDPTTLYTLVSTVEALVSSGITDPWEFFQYVHVSEVGNTTGGGMGGMRSIRRSFRERMLGKQVQGDILQEQLINVMPAWINMLLMSSSGPIKIPVGACATAAHSVELGVDTLQSGKAKIVLVGGYDDFGEEGSTEFKNMQATSNSADQIAQGREPSEHSRPATSSRAGFMEAYGAGVQVLMTADIALKMGVPVYGIVALTNTATDKQGNSVPAPGQGILTTVREIRGGWKNDPSIDINYRQRRLRQENARVNVWKTAELRNIEKDAKRIESNEGIEAATIYRQARDQAATREADKMIEAAYQIYGQGFWVNNPNISPLRGALAVYGLTPDDIEIASNHGTSTPANDKNESHVNQQQMDHLDRQKGNPLFTIWQKWLTGHPKGAAAAWMFNGLVQSMLTGIVPGNKNADNIDPNFKDFDQLVFTNQSIHLGRSMKAGLLKSFGFGQAGGEILVIHPDYLFATLERERFDDYAKRVKPRMAKAGRYTQQALFAKNPLVQVKKHAPYSKEDETRVYVDPGVRAQYDPEKKTWMIKPNHSVGDGVQEPGKKVVGDQ